MAKLSRCRVLLAKVESSYNVDAAPIGADDAILVEELAWQPEGLRMVERPAIRCSLGELQQVYGGSLLSVTFTAEVKGSGTAGTPPELAPLYQGCGMAETVTASTSVEYQPASADPVSLTLYLYEDGTLIKVTGARGTLDFTGEVGGRMMASFNFTGHFSGPTDVAIDQPTYDANVPPILIAGNFDIGGFGAIIQALNVSMGLTVETAPNLSADDGYGEVMLTARDVNGSINPEATLVATKDWMDEFKTGTTQALDSGLVGAVAGNQFQLTMPAVYYRNISDSERQGIQVYDIPFGAAEEATDDEIKLLFL